MTVSDGLKPGSFVQMDVWWGKRMRRGTTSGGDGARSWMRRSLRVGGCGAIAVLSITAVLLASAPVQGYTPPSEVENLRAYAGEDFVELTWGPSWFAPDHNSTWSEKYKIYRGIDGSNLTLYASKEWTGFVDRNVTVGMAYQYMVIAYNEVGKGPGSRAAAYPLPAPSITSCSPTQVEDCTPFTATLEWSPPNDTTSIIGYRVYGSYGWWPVNTSADARSASLELGGWGPHMVRVAAVYADGKESFDEPIYINGPMCEGSGFSYLQSLALLSTPFVIVGIALLSAILVLDHQKKRV